MTASRRRLLQSLPLSLVAAQAQEPAPHPIPHVITLSDERLRILKPVLERRQAQLKALRDFDIDDSIAP
jgi:hypothetical protein